MSFYVGNDTSGVLRQVIYECIFSPSSMGYPRLRVSGATFARWFIERSPDTALAQIAPLVLAGLKKLLAELLAPASAGASSMSATTQKLRGAAYGAVAAMAARRSTIFKVDLEVPRIFFRSLQDEDNEVRASAQEGLSCSRMRTVATP